MPKPSTTPLIIDCLIALTITRLKKSGLLDREGPVEANLSWKSSLTQEETGSIHVTVLPSGTNPHIRISYTAGKNDHDHLVPLVKIPSNLGKGYKWFFHCPQTDRNCSKLYLLGEHFVGRLAVLDAGGLYNSELVEKGYRSITKNHNRVRNLFKIVVAGSNKHFKREFKGVPTKAQLKVNKARAKLVNMGLGKFSDLREYMGWELPEFEG